MALHTEVKRQLGKEIQVFCMTQYKMLHRFKEAERKMEFLTEMLISQPLYLSDEFRDRETIKKILIYYLYGSKSLLYEIGDYGGLLGFIDIYPHYKCRVIMKLWHKALWGATLARELKNFLQDIMQAYDLQRIETDSPDETMVKMAKLVGFKVEGVQKFAFQWDGKLYSKTMLRLLKED